MSELLSEVLVKKDEETRKSFVLLRWVIFGKALIILVLSFLLAYRVGPAGYSKEDAVQDRHRICTMIEKLHPEDPFICPQILEDHQR